MKFKPQLKERIWGGDRLVAMGKKPPRGCNPARVGESWEISGVAGSVSVVRNGFLKSNDLEEVVEVYMGDLVGEKVFEKYGLEFPVLVKFIDAGDVLSIQVHPDDELAAARHNDWGKSEMWYVVDAEPGAVLYVGFNRDVERSEYDRAVAEGTVPSLLNRVEVRKGDCFYIPAGTIHAIGAGVLVAEIQQTSDIIYRVSDWGRVDAQGRSRELHTDLAADAIDFCCHHRYNVTAVPPVNGSAELVSCSQFTTHVAAVDGVCERDLTAIDSFVIYTCVEGSVKVEVEDGSERIACGECLLIAATESSAVVSGRGVVLETYIKM